MTYQPRIGPTGPPAETPDPLQRRIRQVSGTSVVVDGPRPIGWLRRQDVEKRSGERLPAVHEAAELALASRRDTAFARRATRVPPGALVPVGPRPTFTGAPQLAGPTLAPTANANDNHTPPAGAANPIAKALREALFLLILAATLYGVFYSGRQHAFQNVIVVPGPMSFYAEVT